MLKGFLQQYGDIPAAGTALANSVTKTSLFAGNTGDKPILEASYFNRKGQGLGPLRFSGSITTRGTAGDTLNLFLRFGSIDVFDSLLMPLTASALTNVHWLLELELFARFYGDSTTAQLIAGLARWTSHAIIGAPAATAGGAPSIMLPYNTAAAVGAGFDSTAPQTIDLMATWSNANASNSIILQTVSIPKWT